MKPGISPRLFRGFSLARVASPALLLGLLCFLLPVQLVSAETSTTTPERLPLLGQEPVEVEPGVLLYTSDTSYSPEIWIYVPASLPQDTKVPLVLIAASGSPGYAGADLGLEDRPEHLAYVRKGMMVAAYALPGVLPPGTSTEERQKAVAEFQASGSGVRAARNVLNHVLYEFPQADRDMVIAAGINTSASVALNLAAYDDALAGVAVFAPSTDLSEEIGELVLQKLEENLPHLQSYVYLATPYRLTHRIDCPVFVFQSHEDQIIEYTMTERFVEKLSGTNANVTWVEESTGPHYESMMESGINQAIAWIEQTTRWKDRLAAGTPVTP